MDACILAMGIVNIFLTKSVSEKLNLLLFFVALLTLVSMRFENSFNTWQLDTLIEKMN